MAGARPGAPRTAGLLPEPFPLPPDPLPIGPRATGAAGAGGRTAIGPSFEEPPWSPLVADGATFRRGRSARSSPADRRLRGSSLPRGLRRSESREWSSWSPRPGRCPRHCHRRGHRLGPHLCRHPDLGPERAQPAQQMALARPWPSLRSRPRLGRLSPGGVGFPEAPVNSTWNPSSTGIGAPATKSVPGAGVAVSPVTAPVVGSTLKLRLPTPGAVTVNTPPDSDTVGRCVPTRCGVAIVWIDDATDGESPPEGESSASAMAGIPTRPRPRAVAELAKMSFRTFMAQDLLWDECVNNLSIVRRYPASHTKRAFRHQRGINRRRPCHPCLSGGRCSSAASVAPAATIPELESREHRGPPLSPGRSIRRRRTNSLLDTGGSTSPWSLPAEPLRRHRSPGFVRSRWFTGRPVPPPSWRPSPSVPPDPGPEPVAPPETVPPPAESFPPWSVFDVFDVLLALVRSPRAAMCVLGPPSGDATRRRVVVSMADVAARNRLMGSEPGTGLCEQQVHLSVDRDPIVRIERVEVTIECRRVRPITSASPAFKAERRAARSVSTCCEGGRGDRNAHVGGERAKRARQGVRLDGCGRSSCCQSGHHDGSSDRMRQPPEGAHLVRVVLALRQVHSAASACRSCSCSARVGRTGAGSSAIRQEIEKFVVGKRGVHGVPPSFVTPERRRSSARACAMRTAPGRMERIEPHFLRAEARR